MDRLKNIIKNKKILLVCFDAGGADVISSWLYISKYKNFNSFLAGPSVKIFKSKLKKINQINKLLLVKYDLVITGTSLKSSHETQIIKKAKKLNIPVISFMDHWVNYKKRFLRNKKYYLPDIFIVQDSCAKKIAQNAFKSKKIILEKNFRKIYFNSLFKNNFKKKDDKNFLYFSSNYDVVKKKTDFSIINRFVNYLEKSKIKNYKIFIRNHPSEKSNKYNKIIDNKKYFKDNSKSVYECISNYNNFFASESMALVYAKYGKKNVYNLRTKGIEKIPGEILKKNLKLT